MMDVEKEGIDRTNAEGEFKKYVDLSKAVILNNLGEQVSTGEEAFEVDGLEVVRLEVAVILQPGEIIRNFQWTLHIEPHEHLSLSDSCNQNSLGLF